MVGFLGNIETFLFPLVTGECLSGALWWEDLLQLAEEVGFSPPRLVTATAITVYNKAMQNILGLLFYLSSCYTLPTRVSVLCQFVQLFRSLLGQTGDFKFLSATYRLFKVPRGAGKACRVVYTGGLTGMEEAFTFDSQYNFKVSSEDSDHGKAA